MKRIGILSLYCGSLNYGGTLQAFALCRYLRLHGCDARQIAYDTAKNEAGLGKNLHRLVSRVTDPDNPFLPQCKKYFRMVRCAVDKKLYAPHGFDARRASFCAFRDAYIPATAATYTDTDIAACADAFDAFVAGSDIIWNPYLTDSDTFFLSFAPAEKPKIAYAASLGVGVLGASQWARYRRRLAYPDAISTRESAAAELLRPLTDKKIETVLDPTLLLSAEEYADAEGARVIDGDYMFCYLLGDRKAEKQTAIRMAQALRLPLVTIPSPGGEFHKADRAFGDIQLPDAGPSAFLSLIHHAAYVVTDSFHAVAFSVIFHRPFLAFKRHADTDPMSLNSRLTDILSALGMPGRVVHPRADGSELALLKAEIDYEETDARLRERRRQSERFLLEALGIESTRPKGTDDK